MRVSEVCDGLGLVIALSASVAALAPARAPGFALRALAGGVIAIQIFNLARVIALALALAHWPEGFALLHERLFPWLTVLVLAAVLVPPRPLAALALLTAGFGLVWAPLAAPVAALFVGLVNAVLPLGLPELGQIAPGPGGWSIGTFLLAGTEPLRLYRAPLAPEAFTLAAPVILAAGTISRRWIWLVLAPPLMLLAFTLSVPGAVWGLAAAHAPATVLLADGAGGYLPAPYAPPAALWASARLAQNVLVHFLLLVAPVLALGAPIARKAGRAS